MANRVFFQQGFKSKTLATNVTIIRFFARMNAYVGHQLLNSLKSNAATFARKLKIFSVFGLLVVLDFLATGKCSRTDVTRKRET